MPMKAPRICDCGRVVASGIRCVCQLKRDNERKARFDAVRSSARERGYDTQWDKARAGYLKSHPTCRCGAPATVVHHVIRHKGDKALFWDKSNWQTVCKPCHDGPLQSAERSAQS